MPLDFGIDGWKSFYKRKERMNLTINKFYFILLIIIINSIDSVELLASINDANEVATCQYHKSDILGNDRGTFAAKILASKNHLYIVDADTNKLERKILVWDVYQDETSISFDGLFVNPFIAYTVLVGGMWGHKELSYEIDLKKLIFRSWWDADGSHFLEKKEFCDKIEGDEIMWSSLFPQKRRQ